MKNQFFKKLQRGAFVAGALVAGMALTGTTPVDAAPKKGSKLRIAIIADIGGFDSLKIPITGRQRAFVMQATGLRTFGTRRSAICANLTVSRKLNSAYN